MVADSAAGGMRVQSGAFSYPSAQVKQLSEVVSQVSQLESQSGQVFSEIS